MAEKKFLDSAGLTTLLSQLKTKVATQISSYVADKSVVVDSSGKIPASYLPSYVDDIIEFAGTDSDILCLTEDELNVGSSEHAYVRFDTINKVFVAELSSTYYAKWRGTYYMSPSENFGTYKSFETHGSSCYGVTPATGKLYFDTVNNKLYRWSGSALVDISAKDIGTSDLAFTSPNTLKWSENGTAKTATIPDATTSAKGLMTTAMVTKLNGIAAGANAYTLPTASSTVLGGIKVGSNLTIASGVLSAKTMTAATASAAGAAGYVPAPAAGAQAKYLRGDGTWATPTDTTYDALTTAEITSTVTSAWA